MTHFEAFTGGFEKLQLSEMDYYCKLVFLELEDMRQERLQEYVNGDVALRALWPTERDVRMAVVAAHKKLKTQIAHFQSSLPWAATYSPPRFEEKV